MIYNSQGGFLISQIKQVGGRIFEKILAEKKIDDFNGPQGRILYILWQGDSIPIRELSKKTGLALTTLTGMLDRMEAAGLVNRTFDKADRRKVLIVLTEKAKTLKKDYDEVS
jgi:DNA-binding MarR family transcriptional regulator